LQHFFSGILLPHGAIKNRTWPGIDVTKHCLSFQNRKWQFATARLGCELADDLRAERAATIARDGSCQKNHPI
jgi:hypothetical protein